MWDSFHDRIARDAWLDGRRPEQFRAGAQSSANSFWFFGIISAAVWYFLDWRWATVPIVLALVSAFASVSATSVANRIEKF